MNFINFSIVKHLFVVLIHVTAAVILGFNPVYAFSTKPIVIGISTDATGLYSISGPSERMGIEMAIKEFNDDGGVLGRMIETVHIDTRSDPKLARQIAEQFIEQHKVGFIIGAIHSGFAAEFSKHTQKHGVIFLNSNSSSPTEAGKNCHRTKFVWDGNGVNFTTATIKNAVRWIGKRWVLMTHDYEWGHTTSGVTQNHVETAGGTVIENFIIPLDTEDFTPYLEKIRQLKPNVVATAVGGNSMQILQTQLKKAGQQRDPAWLSNQQDWPEVWGSGDSGLFGIFGTTWYHKLKLPGVKDFVARYQKMYPDASIPVPGNVFYNGYMAARELLRAIERAGTTQNHAVIRQLESLKVSSVERMQHYDGYMNPENHHFQQTIYMATANINPTDSTDLFSIISMIPPQEITDLDSGGECELEPFEDTPVIQP